MHNARSEAPAARPQVIVLGPQRNAITVTDELETLGVDGKIATITAGWQEREAEDSELQDAIDHRAVNLRLHHRVDQVFAADPELFRAHRKRQDELRKLQDLYRVRLDAYISAARELFHHVESVQRPQNSLTSQIAAVGLGDELDESEEEAMLAAERDDAVQTLRRLDDHHLRQIHAIHAKFEAEFQPGRSKALQQQRDEVAEIMAGCSIVAIAGGHVATLLGRLRLLDVQTHLAGKPIVAWSGGAMVLTERLVLFHDRPPEGPGNAEILDAGLGIAPQIVALPHATKRLDLDDGPRMALFAQRFAPAMCLVLDPYCRARWNGVEWQLHGGTFCVDDSGRVTAPELADAFGANSWA